MFNDQYMRHRASPVVSGLIINSDLSIKDQIMISVRSHINTPLVYVRRNLKDCNKKFVCALVSENGLGYVLVDFNILCTVLSDSLLQCVWWKTYCI